MFLQKDLCEYCRSYLDQSLTAENTSQWQGVDGKRQLRSKTHGETRLHPMGWLSALAKYRSIHAISIRWVPSLRSVLAAGVSKGACHNRARESYETTLRRLVSIESADETYARLVCLLKTQP